MTKDKAVKRWLGENDLKILSFMVSKLWGRIYFEPG
jgi:hypothetical protein